MGVLFGRGHSLDSAPLFAACSQAARTYNQSALDEKSPPD
jgi:hypothetical protein